MIPPTQAAVLSALVLRYSRDGRATVRQVAQDVGRSPGYVWYALAALREQGMVTWDTGRLGTLRPTVAVGTPAMAQADYDRGQHEVGRAPALTGPDRAQTPRQQRS